MKKILLIFPQTGFDPLKPRMPSSLIYLGTYLETKGYQPVIIDTRTEEDYKEKIKLHLHDSVLVGLTTMTGMQILFAQKIAKLVRQFSPKTLLVWGGVHPSILPEQTIQNQFVDIIVKGEGEETFYELIQALENNQSLETVKGIVFKDKAGKIISTPDREFMDLNKLPMPNFDLVDTSKYRIFDVVSARGCPHRCTFCYNFRFNNRKWRPKSTKKVLEEIEYIIKRYNIDQINLIDDNFFTDKRRVEEICRGIIKKGLKFKWRASCRSDYIEHYDDDFLNLLQQAGLVELFIGAESGSSKILDRIHKDITPEQTLEVARKCCQHRIQSQYSYMMAFPGETKEDLFATFRQIDQIKQLDPQALINMIAIYTPYPGTEMLEECKAIGFKVPSSFEGWGEYSYTFINLPYSGSKRRMYESISYISRFIFYEKELREKFITPKTRIPFEILRIMAGLRWKFKFFKWPLEWVAFQHYIIAKRKQKLESIFQDS